MLNRFIKGSEKGLITLGIGLLFIGVGIYRDEVVIVLMKAISICLECIGIG